MARIVEIEDDGLDHPDDIVAVTGSPSVVTEWTRAELLRFALNERPSSYRPAEPAGPSSTPHFSSYPR